MVQLSIIFRLLLPTLLCISLTTQCPVGWKQSAIQGSDKCYKIVPTAMNWFDADVYCNNAASNAYLTSITSAFENQNINAETAVFTNCSQFWIGASDISQSGQFTWIDGQPFHYVNWAPGQPNRNDFCVSSERSNSQWRTEPCSRQNCFVCASYSEPPTTTLPPPTAPSGMTDCYDWYHYGGARTDGIYLINPPGVAPFNAYCDMTTENGGWTVFHKRHDNTTSFWDRTWAEYKNGFGNGADRNNSWLGLDRLHALTAKNSNVTLRIEVQGNRCPSSSCYRSGYIDPSAWWWAEWYFKVANEADLYRLNVSLSYRGSLTVRNSYDSLWGYNNRQPFSTIDRDNNALGENCASGSALRQGGWWHGSCSGGCRLNGIYGTGVLGPNYIGGYSWYTGYSNTIGAFWIAPNQSEMKLRRNY